MPFESFTTTQADDTYLRPCVCAEEDPVDIPKSFCYVEGTELDKSTSDNVEELGENVWFECKPPKLFKTDIKPLITARQIQISRIMVNGMRDQVLKGMDDEDDQSTKQKVYTKITKKRSAKRCLSNSIIDD